MTDSIWSKLAAPLDPASIKVLAQPGRPPMNYIDSRTVTDRLDAIVPGEWNVTLDLLPKRDNPRDGEEYAIKARLDVLGVTREDVGQGNDYKSAASDALKRAAVRFGIGRELYDHPKADAQATRAVVQSQGGIPVPRPAPVQGLAAGPATIPIPQGDFPPLCPKCGGKMWDNRESKRNPKAPDAKCRDRACDGVIWPEKPNAASGGAKPGRETDGDPIHAGEDFGADWEPLF